MVSEIISIGDEILIGQIVNTNAVFIAKELNKIGIEVEQITSISDNKEKIVKCLDHAKKRVNIIIITGGLGPTNDDLTKHTLCSYFDDVLIKNEKVLSHIEDMFLKYVPTPINDKNREQALLPSKAKILKNKHGTASGMWFEKDDVVFISLPGVPFEMKEIIVNEVIPVLKKKFIRTNILHKTILTYGLGESVIAERIETWENNLPEDIKLAYLPNLGRVRLRLSSKGDDEKKLNDDINNQIEKLYPLIGEIIVGLEDQTSIEEQLLNFFKKNNKTLSLAESCTGGQVASRITDIPGSSIYFKGGIVPYNSKIKNQILNIPMELINKFSVVSEQVAKRMAIEVRKMFNSDISLAITGTAGPSKGESKASIGIVFIAIASEKRVFSEEFNFGNHRERVRERAANKAFELLYNEIINLGIVDT